MSQVWKQLENTAAEKLHGVRKWRRAFVHGMIDSDVAHPYFEIDCKHGKQIPAKIHNLIKKNKNKSFLIPDRDNDLRYYFVTTLDNFKRVLYGRGLSPTPMSNIKMLQFYKNAIDKINEVYNKDRKLMPVVVTKRPREHFEVIVIHLSVEELNFPNLHKGLKAWEELGVYDVANASERVRRQFELESLPYFRSNGEVVDGYGNKYEMEK